MSISDPDRELQQSPPGPASPELERFARETLGCHCPAEVFLSVEDDLGPGLPGIERRIAIGGRLLIYIAGLPDTQGQSPERIGDRIAERIGDWVAAGVAERDRRAMNRLRLVVALDDAHPQTLRAIETAFADLPQRVFGDSAGDDPLVHLHCLPRRALAGLLGDFPERNYQKG